MSALLDYFLQRGIKFAQDGDRLIVNAMPGALTPDILTEIKTQKCELLLSLSLYSNTNNMVNGTTLPVNTCSPRFEQVSRCPEIRTGMDLDEQGLLSVGEQVGEQVSIAYIRRWLDPIDDKTMADHQALADKIVADYERFRGQCNQQKSAVNG